MARYSPSSTVAMPVRKTPASAKRTYSSGAISVASPKARAPRTFTPAIDDPLLALQTEVISTLNGHGKPVGGLSVFGERRAPARRAAFRTPPR